MFIELRGYKIVFLDVEASSLNQHSFPIEVGWVLDDEREPEAVLISPHPTWDVDQGWSPHSEKLHGISLSLLQAEGITAEEACRRLDLAFEGCILVSDNRAHESRWLNLLAEAAGHRPWAVGDVNALYGGLAALAGLDQAEAARAVILTERVYPHPHRAGPDALRMAKAARALVDPAFRLSLDQV